MVVQSGTENRRFSVPLLEVGRNLPSLSYGSAASDPPQVEMIVEMIAVHVAGPCLG